MTQTALTAFETTHTNDDADHSNDGGGGLRIEVIATGQPDEYNDHVDALIDAAHINSDDDALDDIPRHDIRDIGLDDLETPVADPIECEEHRGVEARIHALPQTIGAHTDSIADTIGDIIRDAARANRDDVIAVELGHLGRDTDEIADRVSTLLYRGVHVVTRDVRLDPDEIDADTAGDLIKAIGAAGHSVIPHRDADELINDSDSHTGRPPLGFEYSNGELQTSSKYLRICRELAKCASGEQSQRATARKLDCAPRTVKRAITDHRDRYQL